MPTTSLAGTTSSRRRSTTASGTARRHGVVLRGQLAEWSCDAVGWLAEVVADSAAQLGVRSPLLFTVTRAFSTG